MNYAFTFDASACTGCKACQEACKDKNKLPTGLLWRKVIEVSGGEWHPSGNAWENDVFAYYLSVACNHCTHPKCAGVCPTDAYDVRPDGIVLIDPGKCMGCGYCTWACPYGAPQYDARQGIMTKCNFCHDYLDSGLSPSCVAACPLRVLNFGAVEELGSISQGRNLWQLPGSEHPYPLPQYSRTEPHLVIKPHQAMNSPLAKAVSNQEELQPPQSYENSRQMAGIHELPLVGFTLLAQMAAGMAVISLMLSPVPLPALLTIGMLLAIGGLISFLHLGRKSNAWRSVVHLKKSWLSREILVAGMFGITWAITTGWQWVGKSTPSYWPMAILGFGMVYSMSQVYRLRAVPDWNTWRTPAAFILSMITLGIMGVLLVVPGPFLGYLVWLPLMAEWGMALTEKPAVSVVASIIRFVLIGLGLIGMVLTAIFYQDVGASLVVTVFIFIFVAEMIGRWQFFAGRDRFPIRDHEWQV